jgi:hypothetical protein
MSSFIRIAAVAGLFALTGVAAFAQTDLKADVPFAFETPGNGHMPAGKYLITQVSASSPTPMYRFLSLNTGESVIALSTQQVHRTSDLRAVLTFRCAADTCAISGIYPGGSQVGHGIRVRVKPTVPATEVAEIRIPLGE